jgi:hypothetical protein
MAKITKSDLQEMAAELISLRDSVDRYKELEKLIKENLVRFKEQVITTDNGRVFLSQSTRVSVPVDLATDTLGYELAGKVTVVKKSVSNKLVDAFKEAGEISEEEYEHLMEFAEREEVTSLYVRPLN